MVLIAVPVLGGCSTGGESAKPVAPRKEPAVQTVEQDLTARYRPVILHALARDAACVERECRTAAGLQRRARALAAKIVPADEAFARSASMTVKQRRTATSALRHSVLELTTCFQLSAAKHDGVAQLVECRGPISDFQGALSYARKMFAEA